MNPPALSSGSDALDRLLAQAEPILRHSFGPRVELCDPLLLKDGLRCRVVRCRVQGDPADIDSVILKQIKGGPEASRGFTDWASLAFLSHLPEACGIGPRFYAGDREHGIVAMEDLGVGTTLEGLLTGSDPPAAREALLNLAVQTARLQAGTLGQDQERERLTSLLPGTEHWDCRAEIERWVAGLKGFLEWCVATSSAIPAGFERCCLGLSAEMAEPGPFLAFTHGDPAPTNNHISGSNIRLLDFEYGGFRHALYDITAWNVLCPLPDPLVRVMSDRYRDELARRCPAAAEEARYRRAWARVCAYRALALLGWIPRTALVADRPWVEEWSCRAAVLSTLGRLRQAAAAAPELEPVAEAAERLERGLRSRWPEITDVLPQWPALRPWLPRAGGREK